MNSKQVFFIGNDKAVYSDIIIALNAIGYNPSYIACDKEILNVSSFSQNVIFIIDCNLPDISSHNFIKRLKQEKRSSIIILHSSCVSSECLVEGFRNGIDYYILNPLFTSLALEIIFTAEKRLEGIRTIDVSSEVMLNPESYSITRNNLEVNLTPREFVLFNFLYKEPGLTRTRKSLMNNLGQNGVPFQSINGHIFTLRKKLEKINIRLDTVRKVGYKVKLIPNE